jgi:16S rRNA G966 N2-methylase RsmD
LPFNLVLLDPPYALSVKEVFGMIEMLDQNNLLAQDALVYYEMSKINKSACCEEALRLKWGIIASKDFGDTSYVILGKGN